MKARTLVSCSVFLASVAIASCVAELDVDESESALTGSGSDGSGSSGSGTPPDAGLGSGSGSSGCAGEPQPPYKFTDCGQVTRTGDSYRQVITITADCPKADPVEIFCGLSRTIPTKAVERGSWTVTFACDYSTRSWRLEGLYGALTEGHEWSAPQGESPWGFYSDLRTRYYWLDDDGSLESDYYCPYDSCFWPQYDVHWTKDTVAESQSCLQKDNMSTGQAERAWAVRYTKTAGAITAYHDRSFYQTYGLSTEYENTHDAVQEFSGGKQISSSDVTKTEFREGAMSRRSNRGVEWTRVYDPTVPAELIMDTYRSWSLVKQNDAWVEDVQRQMTTQRAAHPTDPLRFVYVSNHVLFEDKVAGTQQTDDPWWYFNEQETFVRKYERTTDYDATGIPVSIVATTEGTNNASVNLDSTTKCSYSIDQAIAVLKGVESWVFPGMPSHFYRLCK